MQSKNTTYPLKFAVDNSIKYFNEIQNLFGEDINNLRLEEIELTEDDKDWLITLGFNRKIDQKDEPINPLLTITNSTERVYKTFQIDGKTGEVKAIKIKTLE